MIDKTCEKEVVFQHAGINWIPAFVLIATPFLAITLVPWYIWTHDISMATWFIFAFFIAWTGLSITAGYHRLFAHRSYQAHPIIQYFLLLGATFAVQSSCFDWCDGHRRHHKYVDDEYKDPYSAKRGFWFSHIGWMLKNYPSGIHNFKNIPDLKKDKVLQIQHKYYGLWVIVTNVGLLTLIGWAVGDIWGVLLLAGLLRLVINHHCTFFINSLCHMFGSRPYTDSNTARDNFFLAIFTWGEGYHNYHHLFQRDYRNGIKWWHYDPTKWFIGILYKTGLAYNLQKTDTLTIKHAQLKMRFKNAQQDMDKFEQLLAKKDWFIEKKQEKQALMMAEFEQFKTRIAKEKEAFQNTREEWTELKKQKIELKRHELSEKIQKADDMMKEQFNSVESKINNHIAQIDLAVRQLRRLTV